MSALVVSLVLTAAVAHALWNFLSKGARGGAAFVWLGAVCGLVLYLPVTVVALLVDSGGTASALAAFALGSGALHAVYFVFLQRGYRDGDLSLVYPLARGTGPLLSTVAAIVAFGERPSLLALLGGGVIVAAILSLVGSPRALLGGNRQAAVFALLTGVMIAAYTLWDKRAVDTHDLSPIVYLVCSQLVMAGVLTPYVLHRRDALTEAWRTSRGRALGVGLLSPLAYVLILFALTRAPVSYVAPGREVSILFATALGATVLGEGDSRRRLGAALALVVGVAALAVG
jgi:drug/metabolite transporter (DMT)-like permease